MSFLFDSWPAGEAHAPVQGSKVRPPIVGASQKPAPDRNADSEQAHTIFPENKNRQLAWNLALVFLILVTIANTVWTFQKPLLDIPLVKTLLQGTGQGSDEHNGLADEPQHIQLISRDIHTHPTHSGILVLSLTMVNLAQHQQAFPDLEITLLDVASQPVARRRLGPYDYLRDGADIESGFKTDVFLPVLLELVDPGERAVGFEIEFL